MTKTTKEKNNKDEQTKEPSLFGIFKHPFEPEGIDEILEREVVGIGNGAHINIPLKHLGKTARIIIKTKKEGGSPKQ